MAKVKHSKPSSFWFEPAKLGRAWADTMKADSHSDSDWHVKARTQAMIKREKEREIKRETVRAKKRLMKQKMEERNRKTSKQSDLLATSPFRAADVNTDRAPIEED